MNSPPKNDSPSHVMHIICTTRTKKCTPPENHSQSRIMHSFIMCARKMCTHVYTQNLQIQLLVEEAAGCHHFLQTLAWKDPLHFFHPQEAASRSLPVFSVCLISFVVTRRSPRYQIAIRPLCCNTPAAFSENQAIGAGRRARCPVQTGAIPGLLVKYVTENW